MATLLTEKRLPVSAKKAWQLGLCDKVLDKNHTLFIAQVKHLAKAVSTDSEAMQKCLNEKAKTRCYDESLKALATYRKFELTQMYANFYGHEDYHAARKRFVYKINDESKTPENIAIHRQKDESGIKPCSGSMYHFVWQDCYQMDNDLVDSQHKIYLFWRIN